MGAVLRWMERTTGFEAETGLAISGNGPAIALMVLTGLLAAFLIIIGVKIKYKPYFWYDKASLTENPLCFGAYCVAALLMAVAGVMFAVKAMTGEAISVSRLILGVFAGDSRFSLVYGKAEL